MITEASGKITKVNYMTRPIRRKVIYQRLRGQSRSSGKLYQLSHLKLSVETSQVIYHFVSVFYV